MYRFRLIKGCVYNSTGTGTVNPQTYQYGQHRYMTAKPLHKSMPIL